MRAWLDEYAFRTRNNRLAVEPGLWQLDARALMRLYTGESVAALVDLRLPSQTREGLQFEADLHAFFEERFKYVVSAFRVSPVLARSLRIGVNEEEEIGPFAEHLSEHDFSYLDLPGGAFPLGGKVEVKAVFVKVARMAGATAPTAVGFDTDIVIEAVVGLADVFTRQRLTWRLGSNELTPFTEDPGDKLFPRTPDPGGLVASSKTGLAAFKSEVETLARKAVVHARACEGTAMASPLPTIPEGHPALSRPHASTRRTLTPTIGLSAATEVAPAHRTARGGLH